MIDSLCIIIESNIAGKMVQVCVTPEATDEQILEYCNQFLPQVKLVTDKPWHTVIHNKKHATDLGLNEITAPLPCDYVADRLHKVVTCQ